MKVEMNWENKAEEKWTNYLLNLVDSLREGGWITDNDFYFIGEIVCGEGMISADYYRECEAGMGWNAAEMIEKKTNYCRSLIDQMIEAGKDYMDLAVMLILEFKKYGYML